MNPYLIIGLLLAWGASLFGVGAWQRHDGIQAERSDWQARENKELRTANAKILALETAARNAEHDHAQDLAAISTDYERKLKDANDQRSRDVSAARSGAIRLRDPNPPGFRACGSVAASTGSSPGGRDDSPPGELSGTSAEFLLGFANDADDVARQLDSCQQVITADRRLCGQ